MESRPRLVNVEPLMFLYSAGITLYGTLYQAVFAYKQCLERRPGEHKFCRDLGTDDDETAETRALLKLLNEVQASTAQYLILNQMASTIPSVIAALFIGPWCDRHGRKPPLVIATSVSALAVGLATLCVSIDAIPSTTLIFPSLFKGCTGQIIVVHLTSFAMISDTVTSGKRVNATAFTVRVGIASACIAAGSTIGSLMAGLLLDLFNSYAYVFMFAFGLLSLATIYAVWILQETLHWAHYSKNKCSDQSKDKKESEGQHDETESWKLDVADLDIDKNCCLSLFDTMKQTFEVLVKKRDGRRRMNLLVAYFSFLVLAAFDPGNIAYLYFKRPPLSFTDSQYSYLVALTSGSMVVNKVVSPVVLNRFLKLSDLALILIGIFAIIVKYACIAFSTEPLVIVLCTVIGSVSAIEIVGFRSYFGSLVENSERGRLYAAVFIVDTLGPLLSAFIVNNIYAITLPFFPGAVFLLKSIVATVVFLILSSVLIHSHIDRVNLDELQVLIPSNENTPLVSKSESRDVIML